MEKSEIQKCYIFCSRACTEYRDELWFPRGSATKARALQTSFYCPVPADCPLAGTVERCAENDQDFSSGLSLGFVQVQYRKDTLERIRGYNGWRVPQEASRPVALNRGHTLASPRSFKEHGYLNPSPRLWCNWSRGRGRPGGFCLFVLTNSPGNADVQPG